MSYEIFEPEIISFAERYNFVLCVSRGECPEDKDVRAYYFISKPRRPFHSLNSALARLQKRMLPLASHEFFTVAEWPTDLPANFLGEIIWERK